MTPPHAPDRALSATEQELSWLRAIVERSSDMLVAYDDTGTIRYISPSVSRQLGWSEHDLVGTDGMHLVDADEQPRLRAALAAMIGHEGAEEQVFRIRRSDGTWRHLEARGSDHLDDPDVRAVLVSLRDVTERLLAEAALVNRHELYRNLVDATPEPILIHRDDTIVHANRAAAQLLGVAEPGELVGLAASGFFHPGALTADQRWTTGGEHRVLRLDGHGLDVEITAVPTVWESTPSTQLMVRDVTDRREQDLALLHQATHDPLTGLPNRSLLADRLEHASSRAARNRRPFAILFVDLDRFKVVNDTLGHEVGDELLRQISTRLSDAVRPGDTVARLGGDEFVVVIEDLLVTDTVDVVVERIQQAFEEPFTIRDRDFLINASIGVLVTNDGGDPRTLLRDADAAMYAAKTQGRGRAVRFEGALRERASRYADLQLRLRAAIEEDQLRVAYQPVIQLTDRRVVGAEALMRWEHPDRGTLLPETFLDVADDGGILPELGAWVLETTAAQVAAWRRDGAPDIWGSVNVAASELLNPGFAEIVLDALAAHGLPGPALCLEVTERALLDDPVRATQALSPVRDAGVRLAIDDFGSSYTSLAALRRFLPHQLKIDRTFVHGMSTSPTDAATVRAVIQMGHALGISVVAEGVELAEQQHLLGVLGCDMAQGFLLGRPTRPEAFDHLAEPSG